jgi:3',5'-cyclic-AMP phosphodiesterase
VKRDADGEQPVLIGQITDIHIGFAPDNPDEPNMRRLEAVLGQLVNGPNRPDLLLLTGDLTELQTCPIPVWPIPGNHDERAAFAEFFPQVTLTDGFAHYAIDAGDLRILMLDTIESGRHGGAFCTSRAAWLSAELQAHRDRPTVIAMHHPPFAAGIDWMDPDPAEAWIARFAEATRGYDQIQAVLCGHLHRPIVTRWNGAPLIVCPSSAPALALDLRSVDPDQPDGRALITDEPPAYALHRWDGDSFVTHFESVGGFPALASFDAALQPMIRGMLAERP